MWWRLLRWSIALLCVTVVTRLASRRFLYPASEVHAAEAAPTGFVPLEAVAADGTAVHALELRRASSAYTVVYFHNNRQTVESVTSVASSLRDEGFSVVLMEYRGYGESCEESPTEQGLYDDAEAVLDALASRGIGPDRVVLWGTSLGTGVAAEMARRGRGSKLVLVSPYTSIPDLVTDRAPFVPASLLVPDHFDTLSKAGAIATPTLIVHGDADDIVPFWMGLALSQAMPRAALVRVPGGDHSNLFDPSLFARVRRFVLYD